MKKLFLIPLMAMLCTVMAWGTPRTAGTAAQLRDAIAAASAGDVIELTADIAYGSDHTLININKSITLDGKGHKITGYGMRDRLATAINDQAREIVLVVNHNAAASGLNVTIKNLHMIANESDRYIALMVYDGVNSLTLENCEITSTSGYPFVMYGETQDKLNLTMDKTTVNAGSGWYAVLLQRPINANITNSTFEGYCTWYILPPFSLNTNQGWGKRFGTLNSGARGSVISFDNSYFFADNVHSGSTNEFGCFVFEEDGVTLNLNNVGINSESLGDADQAAILLNSWGPYQRHLRKVEINMSGDNTHINGQFIANYWYTGYDKDASVAAGSDQFRFRLENGALSKGTYEPEKAYKGIYYKDSVYVNISGGTYSMNPETYQIVMHLADKYFTAEGMASVNLNTNPWGDGEGGCKIHNDASVEKTYKTPTIATGYEVNEITMEGVATPLYRVVKKAAEKTPGVLYDLNDLVAGEGVDEGNNPVSSFDLSTGTDMTLNNETTTAGYVQIKDNATEGATTVTVGQTTSGAEQTLIINNGLDVQGESQVIVESGATLQIGEGGIVTSKPENIVIEANENGAASLLLDPTITVNQTPELTVEMKVSKAGKDTYGDYHWHRFAMPVKKLNAAWGKDPNYGTYLYGWNYTLNDWEQVAGGSVNMEPWKGYTLSYNESYDVTDTVTYTFKGNLLGNTDAALDFEAEGFQFFGNSYTGYIDVLTLINQLTNGKVDKSVWMWNSSTQTYSAVSLNKLTDPGLSASLKTWQKEVAPMQTFIMRLRGANSAEEAVNYASAIWGNPRYGNTPAAAPMRTIAALNIEAYMEIVVTAANGQSDAVDFIENATNSDAYENGYDASKYMNERHINLYATVAGEDYSSVVTNSLIGKTLSLQTRNDITYTISFENVVGNEYALLDHATNQVTLIAEGNTYEFAAQPNSTVEGRFEIVNINRMPTAIENAEVKANVKGIYTITGQYVGENFEILPAGVYVVDGVKIVK